MGRRIGRREFLRRSGAGLLAVGCPGILRRPVLAQDRVASDGILVVLYLRGGQDALNTVVPYADPLYHEMRPTIAIPAKATGGSAGVVVLDSRFGLHPALSALKPLWDAKQLLPIVNVGSPHPTRSHFDAQDFMEYAAPGLRSVRSGWLNRYLALTAERRGPDAQLRALAMQGLLPRSLRGDYPVLAVPDRGAREANRVLDLFDDLYGQDDMAGQGERMERGEDAVVSTGQQTIEALRRYQQITGAGDGRRRDGEHTRSGYPRGALGDKLFAIAKVIKSGERIEVAAADWNGWDHHAGQGGDDGRHAQMLRQLGDSIAAFLADIGQHAGRTLVVTMTEFGRTCRENGNRGTDHGHGGVMLLAGGRLSGGRVAGRFDGLEDSRLYEGRDLPVTTDFRDVMAEVLVHHMGVKKLPKDFFPDFEPAKKGPGLFG